MIPNFSWIIEGKLAGSGYLGGWGMTQDETLKRNLHIAREKGIGALVTLTEAPLDIEIISAFDLKYEHLPVADMNPPSLETIIQFVEFTNNQLQVDRPVLVHCVAGMGRTGTILACYLVNRGEKAIDAITKIRKLRPGSIETMDQENCVLDYAAYLESD